MEPDLILWENLGFSMKQRAIRIVLIAVTVILLLSVTVMINLYAAKKTDELKAYVPNV